MNWLSGGATVIMHTRVTPAKIINVAENNFAQVYFTPQWMQHLSRGVHEPLLKIVNTFITDIQVPVITQQ